MRIWLSIFIIFTLGSGSVLGQNEKVSNYILSLYNTWDSTYSNYKVFHVRGDSSAGIKLISSKPSHVNNDSAKSWNSAEMEQRVLVEEIEVLKGDIGLGVTAAYAYNLDPGIGFNDNLFYDQKFRTSLGMDLLSSGLLSNKNKAKIKQNELEIMRLNAPEDEKQVDRYLKWHNIIYQFNLKKIEVLKSRQKLAQERVDVASKLNYLKFVSQKDLISTISSHAEIKSMLNIYQSYNEQLSSEINVKAQTDTFFPLLDINYSYSYKLMSLDEPDSVSSLLIENLNLADKAVNDIRVRPYVAYNWFDLVSSNPDYRNYFSVGVTLAAPLNFNTKNKSNLRDAKANLALTPAGSSPEIQQDVLNQFYEFRYKLKQFTSLYHKRKYYEELIRQEQVKHDISPLTFNPISALTLLDNLMKIDIELLDLKQQMYLKLLNIHTDLPYSSAQQLFKTSDLKKKSKTALGHQNSIYIWSSSVKAHPTHVISHYIELNPYTRATISLNRNQEARQKTFKLIDALHEDSIEVEIMIGKNSLINGGFSEYMKELEVNVNWEQINGLHLDVEPHVKDDWHQNKPAYLKKYHDLVKEARAYCDARNINLGVSIPTHYPEEDIRKIFEVVDRVYFMCYENVKTDFIVRKTNKYPVEKTYIALRTNDFKDRLDMENKFKELNKTTKVAGYVMHDFGSILEFDKNSIK